MDRFKWPWGRKQSDPEPEYIDKDSYEKPELITDSGDSFDDMNDIIPGLD